MLFKNDSSDSKESLISLHNTSDEEIFDYNVPDNLEIAQEIDWMKDKPNKGINDFVLVKFHSSDQLFAMLHGRRVMTIILKTTMLNF